MIWNKEEIQGLIEYHESLMVELEEEIGNSSYPPDVEAKIDSTQHIIWLLNDMMDVKSWIYKNFKKLK
jgi:hypothetical protein